LLSISTSNIEEYVSNYIIQQHCSDNK